MRRLQMRLAVFVPALLDINVAIMFAGWRTTHLARRRRGTCCDSDLMVSRPPSTHHQLANGHLSCTTAAKESNKCNGISLLSSASHSLHA
mmetsp:Transcript_148450/g.476792  ORF Transcript_148450/g.476792 Transcript_148450/m.476792 type:complete len:90 (-) Transcript_148450:465-734(-)